MISKVIVGPQWASTQLFKVTIQNSSTMFVEVNISSLDPDGDRSHIICLLGRHEFKYGVETLISFIIRIGSVEKQLICPTKILPSVVNTRIQ